MEGRGASPPLTSFKPSAMVTGLDAGGGPNTGVIFPGIFPRIVHFPPLIFHTFPLIVSKCFVWCFITWMFKLKMK